MVLARQQEKVVVLIGQMTGHIQKRKKHQKDGCKMKRQMWKVLFHFFLT